MRSIFYVISFVFVVLFVSCGNEAGKNKDLRTNNKNVKVEINYNVETLGLIYSLADSDLVYGDFEGRAHLLKYYLKKFEKYKNHPAVLKVKELIKKDIFNSYSVTLGLYFTNFPDFKEKYKPDLSNLNNEEKKEVFEVFNLAKRFYNDANLDSFFLSQKPVYKKIISEVESVLPDENYFKTLEEFHGISMRAYIFVPSVFIPVFFNYGPTINTNKGIINYFLFGPSYDIKVNNKLNLGKDLGYDSKKHIWSTGVHEFGHTFVRFLHKPENKALINSLSYLNTKEIQEKIYPLGYGLWEDVFEEHLVRACEIVIAEKMKNKELRDELYNTYVKELGFKYIPLILEIIPEYEKNRDKYKKFEDFFPRLVEEMKIRTKDLQ